MSIHPCIALVLALAAATVPRTLAQGRSPSLLPSPGTFQSATGAVDLAEHHEFLIENFRTGLVWNFMMKDPVIQNGLTKLGFEYLNKGRAG